MRKVAFNKSIPENGILDLLIALPSSKVVTIERETLEDGDFHTGFIEKITKKHLFIREFSVEAKLDDETTRVKLRDLTSISFDGNYTLFYERYFLREQVNET